MTALFFATDRQPEHLETAQAMLGQGKFLADAIAIAAYRDEGSKRELVCIAVFEGIREEDAALQIALAEGAVLDADVVATITRIAFDPRHMNLQIIHAYAPVGDAGVLAGLIRAGFTVAGFSRSALPGRPDRAILAINRRQAHRRTLDDAA